MIPQAGVELYVMTEYEIKVPSPCIDQKYLSSHHILFFWENLAELHLTSSIFHFPSSILHPPSSIFHFTSSIFHPSSTIFHHLPSFILYLPSSSIFFHLPSSSIFHLPPYSISHHLPSYIPHLPSSSIFHPFQSLFLKFHSSKCTFSSFSSCFAQKYILFYTK